VLIDKLKLDHNDYNENIAIHIRKTDYKVINQELNTKYYKTAIDSFLKTSKDVKFDIYGIKNVQPIWADHYFKTISNCKMGLNLSRGKAIKYYSSDRITQIVGNGLVCLIDENTNYNNFFDDNEMVFYKNVSDLSEKIIKISRDEKLRKKIARKGKDKYMKYFNSTKVANFIINRTLDFKDKNSYLWER